MTALTTAALIAAAKAGGAPGVGYDLIHRDDFDGARWTAIDANDPAAFVRGLYMDGFQTEGDPLDVWPFGRDDAVTVVEIDGDAVVFGENGEDFAAYQVVPADPEAARVCVWWEDGGADRAQGFYFDDAEDHGGFDRISPSGPHSTRHMAELAALDLYRSARFIDGKPLHYTDTR